MSSHQDRVTALQQRTADIDQELSALGAERHRNALDGVGGDQSALRAIARIDQRVSDLGREKQTLVSAVEQLSQIIADEAAAAEARALNQRQVQAADAARALVAIHGEIDAALLALQRLFERRGVLIADLERSAIVNPTVTTKLAGKTGPTAAAQHVGLSKYIDIRTLPIVALRPLSDANGVLVGVGHSRAEPDA